MKKNALLATSLLSVLMLSGCSAETIEQAGLNTLLGMGMAFFVLIVIMGVIYLFPVVLGTGEKKKKKPEQVTTEQSMDNTISQIVANEEQENDTELVAVIAAAIAAYEGSGSTDGFQVRSIRKRGKANWKNGGY